MNSIFVDGVIKACHCIGSERERGKELKRTVMLLRVNSHERRMREVRISFVGYLRSGFNFFCDGFTPQPPQLALSLEIYLKIRRYRGARQIQLAQTYLDRQLDQLIVLKRFTHRKLAENQNLSRSIPDIRESHIKTHFIFSSIYVMDINMNHLYFNFSTPRTRLTVKIFSVPSHVMHDVMDCGIVQTVEMN